MNRGTFFWSCHIPKDKLKQMGAIDILPAKHHYLYGFQPEADPEGLEWVFKAEPDFETLVKFACDKGIVEVSHRHHRSIARGRNPKIGHGSKLSNRISNLKFTWNTDK
jgi:hypothetical protein